MHTAQHPHTGLPLEPGSLHESPATLPTWLAMTLSIYDTVTLVSVLALRCVALSSISARLAWPIIRTESMVCTQRKYYLHVSIAAACLQFASSYQERQSYSHSVSARHSISVIHTYLLPACV
jgi:hypothetical protein